MRIAFINPNIQHEYDVEAPLKGPFPGSESAQCYLAMELARRGHEVSLFSGSEPKGLRRGVQCAPVADAERMLKAARHDVILALNFPSYAHHLRTFIDERTALIAWDQNFWFANPEPYQQQLKALQGDRDYILCVSDWHREDYLEHGKLDPQRVKVLRNATGPAFCNLFQPDEPILGQKSWPPVMAYTSVPYKGLPALLDMYPHLRQVRPDLSVNIFSSFDLYAPNNVHRQDSQWQEVYRRCKETPGVNYPGIVPQADLARAMRGTSILFYPNTMPETSSICTFEAMAAGCVVVAPALGALPETMSGFGLSIPTEGDGFSIELFLNQVLGVLAAFDSRDEALEKQLRAQVNHIHEKHLWSVRAREAEALFETL